jgi:uncharacterized protein (TIGR02118 family)
MIKHISIINRPPNLTHEQLVRYWNDVHAKLVRTRLPGLRKYVGNFPVQPGDASEKLPGGGKRLQCDAIVELHFDDLQALRAAMSSPGWLSDERKKSSVAMIDYSTLQFAVVEEVVVPLDAPASR